MDKVRDRLQQPLRHIKSFVEPDGQSYESQLPETSRTYGNTAANLSAAVTHNALEMHQWHEMDAVVHSQFGTVDNPVLVFTSDSAWRIVICMGPGIEDDAHSHEKMYYFVREGPMHRCHVCGQCFKIVRLKDEASEQNDYYSTMFADINHFEIAEEDMAISLTQYYGDRPMHNMQTIPATNVYIHVNNDEADRLQIDPAYKLERMKEAHEKVYAFEKAYKAVDEQMREIAYRKKVPYGRDMYETWYQIEKSIMKFDRIFNKVEKFDARALTDPVNHERRQKRMLKRKAERWTKNYTYFFGNLTEEEQMYRDYFQTDMEQDPEDDYLDEKMDEYHIASTGQFNPANFDFMDYTQQHDAHEDYNDIVEQKLFKYKYRQNADDLETYTRRQVRVRERFLERAKTRDKAIEQDLAELFEADARDTNVSQFLLNPKDTTLKAQNATRPIREYMVGEAVQQYRDYYESDAEEQGFFEYLDNFPNRDQIRFMEIFEDFTVDKTDHKAFATIPKREYNPELSVLSNMVLDLVDFKDRVRPLSQDIALLERTRLHQRRSVAQLLGEETSEIDEGTATEKLESEGYSSAEIPEPKAAEVDAAVSAQEEKAKIAAAQESFRLKKQQQKAEAEAARLAAQQEADRLKQEKLEAAIREADRIEAEKGRLAAEAKAARLFAEVEAKRQEAERQRLAEEEAARIAAKKDEVHEELTQEPVPAHLRQVDDDGQPVVEERAQEVTYRGADEVDDVSSYTKQKTINVHSPYGKMRAIFNREDDKK